MEAAFARSAALVIASSCCYGEHAHTESMLRIVVGMLIVMYDYDQHVHNYAGCDHDDEGILIIMERLLYVITLVMIIVSTLILVVDMLMMMA